MSNSFFYRVILIPAAVWLSVFFGGSTGSGVEVVQFFTSNGQIGGLIAIAGIIVFMAIVMYLCFELARKFQAYDYQKLSWILLNKGWWIYEIAILISMVLVIAIASTASGKVIGEHYGISHYWGQSVSLFTMIFFTYKGLDFIEKSMTVASIALLIILVIITGYVYFTLGDVVADKFSADSVSFIQPMQTALQYAMVNIAFFPLLLFIAKDIRTGKESTIAAISAAVVCSLPLLAFHYSFVSHYPEINNLAAEVPVYWLLDKLGSTYLIDVYVVVLFVLIVQTGVGMMQGFVERVDNYLSATKGKPMTAIGHAATSTGMIIASLLLSSVGIVALVIQGYKFLFLTYVVIFFIPLFTIGVWKLYVKKAMPESTANQD